MIKRAFLVLQILFVSLLPGAVYAERTVMSDAPIAPRYDHYAQAQGKIPVIPGRNFDEEEREKIKPARVPMPRQNDKSDYSALEEMYSGRTGETVLQFGYDLFGVPVQETQDQLDQLARNEPQMPMGAVQDDFILHSGDELEITFAGQRTDHGTYKVNTQGLIVIQDLPPIPAEGRAIGQVRLSIEGAARNLHNTDAYISLSSVRQIGVLVIGHVRRPGRQNLTVFNSVIDALMEAGGIDKTGSLRQVKLIRSGKSSTIDLYSVLMRGGENVDLQLRDGDRIIVPSIGPTVAIAGEIKRPGIYEIPQNAALNLGEMLDLGGSVLVPGRNRFLAMEVTRSGHERVSEIRNASVNEFSDGAILMVEKGQETRSGTVELRGHTRRPGLYALDESQTLSALFSSSDILGPDAYPLISLIERRDQDKLARILIDFPLRLVIRGGYDAKLQDSDVIHIFSDSDIRRLDEPLLKNAAYETGDALDDEAIASYLKERSAFVRGAIRSPGAYPVAKGVTLDSLMAVAGGPTLEADMATIEVTGTPPADNFPEEKPAHEDRIVKLKEGRSGISRNIEKTSNGIRRRVVNTDETNPSTIVIAAGDAVRINQKFQRVEDKSVMVMGEVKNPGRYDLLPGDKVSDLLRRAGGLTDQAYADGAIFSRDSERRAEEARFRAQAQQLQTAIASALKEEREKVNAEQIAEARALAQQLGNAEGVGRITVEADPDALNGNSDIDMLLEAGDRLYIPKRSMTVRVSGEVFSPASLQFRKEKKPKEYVEEAGGFTYNADKDRAFVLYPNGSAEPIDSWRKSEMIPPGSTIVIPRDPKPFDFMQSAKDVSQILSNLAISALFVDDIKDSN